MFGSSFQFVNYINCDKKPGDCLQAGVEGYPTLFINGTTSGGVRPLAQLSELSGCVLPEVSLA